MWRPTKGLIRSFFLILKFHCNMIKESVLNALKVLGFEPEEIDEVGYGFKYEDVRFLYAVDDDDTTCVTLMVPRVFEFTPENRAATVDAMVKLCAEVKYVQPSILFDDEVWLSYQHFLGEDEVTPELLEHMIRLLSFATYSFHNTMNPDGDDN